MIAISLQKLWGRVNTLYRRYRYINKFTLKKLITYSKRYIVVLLLLFNSCVNDDSFFPEETDGKITSTVTLVTFLNHVKAKGDIVVERDLCFSFVYPIVLGYNTDSTIRVNSFLGLVNVIASQRNNFNIEGIQFPIEVVLRESTTAITIENEDAFYDVLKECQLNTFRDDFNTLFRQCYMFEYPITLLDDQKVETILENEESFDRFIIDQRDNYQPDFKFPIRVLVAPDFEAVSVSTYYEFYDIINNCVGCPNIRFDIEQLSNTRYQIIPNFEIREGYEVSFKINGEVIADVVIDGNPFIREFTSPETYEICIKVVTPDCPQGKKVCKEIVVATVCPDLRFEFEREPDTFSYNFVANFAGINETTYNWIVDDQIIEDNDGGANGDNMFAFQFTPGIHNVCISTETPLCPNGTEFCQEIIICPEPFFIAEQQGNTNTYDFSADFLGMNDIIYEWTVNGEVIESDGGAGGDNRFTFQFDASTSNEVCLVTEVAGCITLVKFCMNIDIQ